MMSEINPSSLNHTQKIQWLTEQKMKAMGYSLPQFDDDFDPEAELEKWLADYSERSAKIKRVNQVSEADREKEHQDRLAYIDKMRQQEKLEKEQLYQRIEELERKVDFLLNRENPHD